MTNPRPFRFGVQSYAAASGAAWRATARRAEELGYASLLLADHFLGPGPAIEPTNHGIQTIAAIPAIAVAAEATTTLRVGSRVLCNDYRHPAVLAKEAATLDLFSDGRLELGLGAGWLKNEYEAASIPFDRVGTRIERLAETISFLRQHFAEGMIEVDGEHVRIRDYEGVPKPVQKPHPPLMVGGGSRRILELAAREADIVSFNFNNRSGKIGQDGVASGSAGATAEKLAWVREAAGARFGAIELEVAAYFTHLTDDAAAVAQGYAERMGLPADEIRNSPHALMGSAEEIVELLCRRREEYGFSYVTVSDRVMEEFAPVVGRLAGA